MNALRYRFATPDDAALLARLNAQLVAEGADFGPTEPDYLERRMRGWLSSGHDRAVLFEDQRGRLVAYALYEEQAQEIYLRQFLVRNAARHSGVGRQAFELLRSKIWSAQKRLTLEVLCSNRAGYRFWRSLGYRNCAVTLEIPASTATQRAQAGGVFHTPVLAAPPAAIGSAALNLAASPLRLLHSLRRMAADAAYRISRFAGALLFFSFVSMPVAAAAANPAIQTAHDPPGDATESAHQASISAGSLTDAELHALRSSGGHCAASIYRTAWLMASLYHMDPAWIAAVIEAESSCRSDAVSKAGAMGLMQLVPGSGARDAYRLAYGLDQPPSKAELRDPQANIRMGVAYLHGLHQHFINIDSAQARLLLAIASYNCGTDLFDQQLPTASAHWDSAEAERWIGLHAPRETHGYVKHVRSTALRYVLAISAAHAMPATLANGVLAP